MQTRHKRVLVSVKQQQQNIRNGNTCKRGTNGCWFSLNKQKNIRNGNTCKRGTNGYWFPLNKKIISEMETRANEAQTGVGFR